MNKHCYRIIFNKARGLLMAVAETTTNQAKASGTTSAASNCNQSTLMAVVRPIAFFIWGLLGLVMMPAAYAQITADPAAPGNQRPTVLAAPNNVPLVNIQTPSAAGVSRNTYSQFDVQQQGAILNNSRSNVQTQLGGWVPGNPWLTAGSARVILNEVHSSNPSLLHGHVEIAGQRAQIIIANPAGISCDGCGFINASRATMTTGTPIINNGNLEAFRVQRGEITIKGMNANATDYTDIISRAVQIDAGVWAKQLKVIAGANQVSIDQSNSEASVSSTIAATDAAPKFAIDSAQLGGMYAQKIILLATEAGAGVRNAGKIYASVGDVLIDAHGQLHNTGKITSGSHARIDTKNGMQNIGTVYAKGNTTLDTHGDIHNQGIIAAQGNTTLNAAGVDNTTGVIRANKNVTLTGSRTLNNTNGLVSAGDTLTAQDQTASPTLAITNTGGTLIAGRQLTVKSSSLSGDGKLLSKNDLKVRLRQNVTNTGQIIANGKASVETDATLSNQGKLTAGKTLNVKAATIDNQTDGQIIARTVQLHVTDSHTFTNRGLIDGTDTFIDSPTVNNIGTGRIYGDHLAVSGTTLNNQVEAINGVAIAPTIAARERLDLGFTIINNNE